MVKFKLEGYRDDYKHDKSKITWWYWGNPLDLKDIKFIQHPVLIVEKTPNDYSLDERHLFDNDTLYDMFNDLTQKTHSVSLIDLKMNSVKHFKWLKRKYAINNKEYCMDKTTFSEARMGDLTNGQFKTSKFRSWTLPELRQIWSDQFSELIKIENA